MKSMNLYEKVRPKTPIRNYKIIQLNSEMRKLLFYSPEIGCINHIKNKDSPYFITPNESRNIFFKKRTSCASNCSKNTGVRKFKIILKNPISPVFFE